MGGVRSILILEVKNLFLAFIQNICFLAFYDISIFYYIILVFIITRWEAFGHPFRVILMCQIFVLCIAVSFFYVFKSKRCRIYLKNSGVGEACPDLPGRPKF